MTIKLGPGTCSKCDRETVVGRDSICIDCYFGRTPELTLARKGYTNPTTTTVGVLRKESNPGAVLDILDAAERVVPGGVDTVRADAILSTCCVLLPDTVAERYQDDDQVEPDDDGCPRCKGTGREPDGWTLDDARTNPHEYNKHKAGPGAVSLTPGVVSPLGFVDGVEKCRECFGTGVDRTVQEKRNLDRVAKRDAFFDDLLSYTAAPTVFKPEGGAFVTIHACYNDSDSMTDYYAPSVKVGGEFVVAVLDHTRRLEKSIRKAIRGTKLEHDHELTWNPDRKWLESGVVGESKLIDLTYQGPGDGVPYWFELRIVGHEKELPASKWFHLDTTKHAFRKSENARTL